MAVYTSKKQAQEALRDARQRLKDARKAKDAVAKAAALKDCQDIQFVLDRWY